MDVNGPAQGPVPAVDPAGPAQPPTSALDGLVTTPATSHGLEAAIVQTGVGSAPGMREAAPLTDAAPPAPPAQADAALPAAQLVQTTLLSLMVDPETWWLLQRDRLPQRPAEPEGESAAARPSWREALAFAVRSALRVADPLAAVRRVEEEWRRGRRVVLACPRGCDPGGPAWAYVTGEPLSSPEGVRLAARLRWFDVPAPGTWRDTRLERSYHPLCGRYLNITGTVAGLRSPCAIQLGPTLSPWPGDVCVRIDAVGSFWDALGMQWSVLLAVSALPLERTA